MDLLMNFRTTLLEDAGGVFAQALGIAMPGFGKLRPARLCGDAPRSGAHVKNSLAPSRSSRFFFTFFDPYLRPLPTIPDHRTEGPKARTNHNNQPLNTR